MFVQYQELAMRMFGGYMNYTWNPTTKKLTLVRKMPETTRQLLRVTSMTASGTAIGSTITIVTHDVWNLNVGNVVKINNCAIGGYNGTYSIQTIDNNTRTLTLTAAAVLQATSVTEFNLRRTEFYSPDTDAPSETVLLWVYNHKPDVMLLNDTYVFPWLQDYAYSFAKFILGEARSKFTTIAGPQGGTQLNGTALIAEAKEELAKLEEELKLYVEGSTPITWVIG